MISNRALKRKIREKPFLLDSAFQLSGKEAEAIMQNNPEAASIERILQRMKMRPDWDPEIERLIQKVTEKTAKAEWNRVKSRIRTGIILLWHSHVRAISAAAAMIVFGLFLLLIPAGRTVADGLYRLVVQFLQETLYARNECPLEGIPEKTLASLPMDLATPEELSAVIDMPIFVSKVGTLVSFNYEVDDLKQLTIIMHYSLQEGRTYTVYQYIYSENSLWGLALSGANKESEIIKTKDGRIFYLKELQDRSLSASAFQNAYAIEITGILSKEEIRQIILLSELIR
jgi:hypothetical protein